MLVIKFFNTLQMIKSEAVLNNWLERVKTQAVFENILLGTSKNVL